MLRFNNNASISTPSIEGGGFFNSAINKLPFEIHLPGYQFCGPGTKLNKRLERGDPGVNKLDSECRLHDIAYQNNTDLESRHRADNILANKAFERVIAPDSGFRERLDSLLVGTLMKTKSKLGLGMAKTGVKAGKNKRKASCPLKKISFNALVRGIKKNSRKGVTEKSPYYVNSVADMIATSKKFMKNKRLLKNAIPRVIPIPKSGGVLPLIPIFAGLSALGSLMGGVATVAKKVIDIKNATKNVVSNGTSVAVGNGMYLKPYKTGVGLYLAPFKPTGNGIYLNTYNSKN